MSYPVLLFWWFEGDQISPPIGNVGAGTASAPALVLPEPMVRYDRDQLLQMQAAVVQFAGQTHTRLADLDHPYSMTVRRRVIAPWVTFTANDTTPSVATGRNFKTANTVPTTISSFDDGVDGQEITVRVDDSSTVFDFTGSLLVGNGGADHIAANGDQVRAVYDSAEGVWYCQVIEA